MSKVPGAARNRMTKATRVSSPAPIKCLSMASPQLCRETITSSVAECPVDDRQLLIYAVIVQVELAQILLSDYATYWELPRARQLPAIRSEPANPGTKSRR